MMRRLLVGAVAMGLLLGGLVAVTLSARGSAGTATLDEQGRAALMTARDDSVEWAIEERATDDASTPARKREHSNAAAAKGISFRPPVDFATGANPSSAAFNKASGEQAALMTLHLALSDSVVAGDFNGDGHADVVQTNVLAGSLSIFLGDGRGGFAAPALHPIGINPSFAVAGELDGDGNLDLAIADTNGVSILRGDGNGGFAALTFLSVPAPRNVAIGRIDSDGIPDLAIASAGPVCHRLVAPCDESPSEGGVHAFVGRGPGAFVPVQFIPLTHSTDSRPVGANFVALHDFNGDDLGDLAVTVGTTNVAFDRAEGKSKPTGDDLLVFLNRGAVQPFEVSPDQPAIRVGGTPDAIAVGDWDGDTQPDLATLETSSGSITSLLGDASGHFEVKSTTTSVGGAPRGLTVGDFDGDGVPDLVTARFAASTVSVLKGNADGTFQPAVDHRVGNAPTSAAVGHFDGDRRLDIVVGRLRTDQLSLLVNDGPRRGDGVAIHRDIPYGSPTHPSDDPFPTKHTLDVYVPPLRTATFVGSGDAYPVVFFAHGGARNNNKSDTSYLLRSLSAQGIVVVSTNYRLTFPQAHEQVQDIAQAFRWTRDNIGSPAYGGDPDKMVAFGHSSGAALLNSLATDPQWAEEQEHVLALVIVSGCGEPGAAVRIPESLLLTGDEGFELVLRTRENCDAYAAAANKRGTKSTHVNVPGRDHFTLLADLALADDPGRVALDAFLREQLNP